MVLAPISRYTSRWKLWTNNYAHGSRGANLALCCIWLGPAFVYVVSSAALPSDRCKWGSLGASLPILTGCEPQLSFQWCTVVLWITLLYAWMRPSNLLGRWAWSSVIRQCNSSNKVWLNLSHAPIPWGCFSGIHKTVRVPSPVKRKMLHLSLSRSVPDSENIRMRWSYGSQIVVMADWS